MTRDETSKYTDLMPDGTARQFTFMMEAKSLITYPSGGQKISPGFCEITGLAWTGRGRITRVEVSTDGGATWNDAALQEPRLPRPSRASAFPGNGMAARPNCNRAAPMRPAMCSRQARRWWTCAGCSSTYHYNGIKAWKVAADGACHMRSLALMCVALALCAQSPKYGVGRAPTPDEIRQWAISVRPDGKGLPAGSGTAAEGKEIYATRCSRCHGAHGEGRDSVPLVGGRGTLNTATPLKTVESYWPYATTLFDYVNRAMPFDKPGTLTTNQVYALTAYVLLLGGIIPENAVIDAKTLPKVQMPNREGFVPDPRPDVGRPAKKK